MIFVRNKNVKHPILISIAHSSYFVPNDIRRRMALTDFDIKKSCDNYTDKIFDVPDCYIVKSKISRLVADVNRAPDDIESETELMSEGVVVRVNDQGILVYNEPPTLEMIHKRIETYHNSFHQELDRYAEKVRFLIDGHSMLSVGPQTKHDAGKQRADICLGNRRYSTCDFKMTRFFSNAFHDFGYKVAINNPYEGAYILGYHSSRRRLPGIQIEFNKRLYMDEKTLRPVKGAIKKLNGQMCEIVERLVERLG